MSSLRCSAGNCVNNEHGLCALPIIRVDGDDAKRVCDTFCQSFSHRTGSAQNSVFSGNADERTEIKCTAEECAYNSDGYCDSPIVEVSGSGASRSGETECRTFKKK
ncbi:MAG: DUF1540 domain-containing protein [Clostridia bacterium]|nr:DUF1540 domain-containing protein [Clostridia bacterium]